MSSVYLLHHLPHQLVSFGQGFLLYFVDGIFRLMPVWQETLGGEGDDGDNVTFCLFHPTMVSYCQIAGKDVMTVMTVKTLPVQEAFVLVEQLDLPPEYTWFNELSAEERSEFFKGLLEILTARKEDLALPDGRPRTRMAALDEYVRGWQATVEIESSPELLEAIQHSLDDARHGRFVSPEEVEEFLRDV
jgi:hypothetical protein